MGLFPRGRIFFYVSAYTLESYVSGKERIYIKKIWTIEPLVGKGCSPLKKLKVCAYCRVTTSLTEQKHSFLAQVEHYTSYIKNNSAWKFAGIYSDEVISGKSKDKRKKNRGQMPKYYIKE